MANLRRTITSTAVPGDPRVFGSVPEIPTSSGLQQNVLDVLNTAIPGFGGLTRTATDIIGNAMAGQLSPQTQAAIRDAAATQAVSSGMPGASGYAGTLSANRTLRDIGRLTEDQQHRGFQDLLSLLGGVSGTAALTPAQVQQQETERAEYAASPIPSYAIPYMQNQYQQALASASSPAGGTGGSVVAVGMRGRGVTGSVTRTPAVGLGLPTTQYL